MNICEHNRCTGCGACINACPIDCISLIEDAYGELHPSVETDKCLSCGKCVATCPNNAHLTFRRPKHCYAAWVSDSKKRAVCASGGLATVISEYAIRHKNAVVFGTAYDEELTPYTTFSETIEGLEAFKGSKYVQSIVSRDTFHQVKGFLDRGRFVVYVGTPCQIAGLQSYLGRDYANLLTVDLICHGVAPTRYFCDEVAEVRKRLGRDGRRLSNVRFRGNDGYNFRMTFWDEAGCRLEGRKLRHDNLYFVGFLRGVILRENCYSCPYARPERNSDLTLGDFIGLGKTIPFPAKAHNVSSVMLNTDRAMVFYADMLAHAPDVVSVERDYAERLEYSPSLLEPFARHPLNRRFRDYYPKFGYAVAIRKTLMAFLLRERICRECVAFCKLPIRVVRKGWKCIRRAS